MTSRAMKRDWGLFLVVALSAIVAALLLIFLQPREPNLPGYDYSEPRTAGYQPGGPGCQPQILASIPDKTKATAERNRCAEEAENYRLQRNDLVEQARAADAAQAQTWLSYELARMALWGTVGGFLTLIAASLAAFYAREAARASRDSLNAFVAAEDACLAVEFPNGTWVESLIDGV